MRCILHLKVNNGPLDVITNPLAYIHLVIVLFIHSLDAEHYLTEVISPPP